MSTPLRRRIRHARRFTGYGLLVLLILAATLVGGLNQLLPLVERHPDKVAAWLSDRIGQPVAFSGARGEWTRRGPRFTLDDLRIGPAGRSLDIGRAELLVAVYSGLLPGAPLTELKVRELSLVLEQGEDRRWRMVGLPFQPDPAVDPLETLEALGELQVERANLAVRSPAFRRELRLPRVDLRLRVSGDRLLAGVRAKALIDDETEAGNRAAHALLTSASWPRGTPIDTEAKATAHPVDAAGRSSRAGRIPAPRYRRGELGLSLRRWRELPCGSSKAHGVRAACKPRRRPIAPLRSPQNSIDRSFQTLQTSVMPWEKRFDVGETLTRAMHAFWTRGYEATSMQDLVAATGVNRASLYATYGDKRALFTAAVECECEKMRGHFSLEAMPSGTIRERLIAIGEAIFAFLFRPEMIQFERRIAAETEVEPAVGAAFLEAGPWRMKRAFAAFLQHAVSTGELAIDDPELAAEQFVSMCKGMGDLERRFGADVSAADRTRRIAGAVEVFLAAYGHPNHR